MESIPVDEEGDYECVGADGDDADRSVEAQGALA